MTKAEMIADRIYIIENTGKLTPFELMYFYEVYANGSSSYLLAVEHKGKANGFFTRDIPLEYCSCQMDHKKNNQYLYCIYIIGWTFCSHPVFGFG